jgi:uncharacterized membrane protein (UPF0136 family)
MNPRVGLVVLVMYAVLLIVGGVMGLVKGRSKASLIAGVVSGLIAVAAVLWISGTKNEKGGYALGLTLAIVLFLFFGYRAAMARRFMPGGMLAIASAVVMAVMVWSLGPTP